MGDLAFFFSILIPGLATPLAVLVARDKMLQRAWRRSAAALDLSFLQGPLMGGDRMEGSIGGHRVLITSDVRRSTRVLIDATRSIPDEIHLSLKAWGFVRTDGSLASGDEDFDRTIYATGSSAELLARLNRETRAIVRESITSPPGRFTAQIEVLHGWISYTAPGVVVKVRSLTCIIHTLIRLAESLRLDGSAPAALRRNACLEQEEMPVRLKNLHALIDHFPYNEETDDACRTALRAKSWMLRLDAAKHLDDTREGINTLLSILRSADAPTRARVRALLHLIGLDGKLPPDDDVIAVSREFAPELRIAAAEVLGFRRSLAAVERLLEMIRDPRFEVVEKVAATLAALPSDDSEHALVSLLAHDAIEVRRTAAHSLGAVGTVFAVEPLLATARGVLTDTELKSLARRAVARIQGRLVGADAGHLSLAERERGGSLSFTPSDGALSLEDG